MSFNLTVCLLSSLCVSAQESGGSPCPSSCPDLNKSQTLSSLSEGGAVLVEVCCLLVLAVDNKVFMQKELWRQFLELGSVPRCCSLKVPRGSLYKHYGAFFVYQVKKTARWSQ